MQSNLMVEERPRKKSSQPLFKEDRPPKRPPREGKRKMEQQRKRLMDAIGKEAYNGVDVFEGTEPMRKAGSPNGSTQMPSVLGDDTGDAGVDISSLIAGASQVWKAIK